MGRRLIAALYLCLSHDPTVYSYTCQDCQDIEYKQNQDNGLFSLHAVSELEAVKACMTARTMLKFQYIANIFQLKAITCEFDTFGGQPGFGLFRHTEPLFCTCQIYPAIRWTICCDGINGEAQYEKMGTKTLSKCHGIWAFIPALSPPLQRESFDIGLLENNQIQHLRKHQFPVYSQRNKENQEQRHAKNPPSQLLDFLQ